MRADTQPKESAWKFVYNSEKGEFLGRTGLSWAKITIFYIIFFIFLAAFFYVCMMVFFLTIDDKVVKWQLGESVIGTNPGLGYRPKSKDWASGSSLIRFKMGLSGDYHHYVNDINTFLNESNYDRVIPPGEKCAFGQTQGKTCKYSIVDVTSGTSCTKAQNYGYETGQPCIFLKLNKIFGWKPECYNNTNEDLPANIPSRLVKQINATIKDTTPQASAKSHPNYVWVTCDGTNPADREHMGWHDNDVVFSPGQGGFPSYFFPFTNQDGYQSPLVAVQFKNLRRNRLISVECRVWAKNIEYVRADKRGQVQFEFFIIEDPKKQDKN